MHYLITSAKENHPLGQALGIWAFTLNVPNNNHLRSTSSAALKYSPFNRHRAYQQHSVCLWGCAWCRVATMN